MTPKYRPNCAEKQKAMEDFLQERWFLNKNIDLKAREKQCFVSKDHTGEVNTWLGEQMQLRDTSAKPAFLVLTMCVRNGYFHTLHVVVTTCLFCLLLLYKIL